MKYFILFQATQTTKSCTVVQTNAAALRSQHHARWTEDIRSGSSAPAANTCSGVRPPVVCITSMQIRLIAPRPPITHRALNLHRLVSYLNQVYLLIAVNVSFEIFTISKSLIFFRSYLVLNMFPLISEKVSLLSRLFRRSGRSKQTRAMSTFSAQFPPTEWFNSKAVHLHCVATQTNSKVCCTYTPF